MKDTLTIDQLKIQRAATKKRLEIMVRARKLCLWQSLWLSH